MTQDYSIAFDSKNPSGVFESMTGDILFDPSDLGSSLFQMQVDVASIKTGNGLKNKHARGSKWFDAEQYPSIRFQSTLVQKKEDGYAVVGKLTIRDVTRQVVIPFTFEDQIFVGSFDVNRKDFGLGSTKGIYAKADTLLAVSLRVPVQR